MVGVFARSTKLEGKINMKEDLRLPLKALFFIEQIENKELSMNRLYRKRTEYVARQDWDNYLNVGLALMYLSSVEKYEEKTGIKPIVN